MKIELKVKPLSVNQAWQGRRFKTDTYKEYEKTILFLLPKTRIKFADMLRIEFHFGFSNLASDLDNPVKPLLDILQKKYGFNDRDVFELNVRKNKVGKGDEFINIGIYPMLPFDY